MQESMQALIDWAHENTDSSFYREKWGSEKDGKMLPSISRNDLLSTPLSERRYKNEKAFIKIVRSKDGIFASEWSFSDIAKEDWGPVGHRPLVYMEDPDETLEKTLWCYERNVFPLIAENILEITQSAARFYRIDSMVTDLQSLKKLGPYLAERTEPLEYISIIGASFEYSELLTYALYAKKVTLVLALPETGAIAHALVNSKPSFKVAPDCHVEMGERLLLTKLSRLTTPIIRYELPVGCRTYLTN